MAKQITMILAALLLAVWVYGQVEQEEGKLPPEDEDAAQLSLKIEAEMCRSIEERMPSGMADTFPPDVEQVFCWSKVIGAEDSTMIKHVWLYKGERMAEVELPVRSSAWRTWSSKKILPQWVGDWEVRILDESNNLLANMKFYIDERIAN